MMALGVIFLTYAFFLILTAWNLGDCINDAGIYSGHNGGSGCHAWHVAWIIPAIVVCSCLVSKREILSPVKGFFKPGWLLLCDHQETWLIILNFVAITCNVVLQIATALILLECDYGPMKIWNKDSPEGGCDWWHLLWVIPLKLTVMLYVVIYIVQNV